MTSLRDDATTAGMSRRALLRASAAAGLGIAFTGSMGPLAGTAAAAAPTRSATGYGPLVPDPAKLLALPEGFSYRIVAKAGVTVLSDGPEKTPDDADGSVNFPTATGSTLINNHEIGGGETHPVPARLGLTYDPAARGGTTNIDVDAGGSRIAEYVSVAGTHNNCAGGPTPWKTWLTCEETEDRAGKAITVGGATSTLTVDHGFVFEVSPIRTENAGNSPVPLKFLGRYAHEAVAVDPGGTIYLTEDANGPHGLFYRWTPPAGFTGGKWALKALAQAPGGDTAGTLQAMSCALGSTHITDLSEATRPGTRYKVTWVDVPDRLAATTSTRLQLTDTQVTRSRKLEGTWWADGGTYVVASFARTSDGSVNQHDGQVWFYDPATSTLTLTTIFGVNPDPSAETNYDGPDNITVSPHGGVILAEDGEGVQHLVGVTDQGKAYSMARNELNDSEFTGPNFTADGKILFANIQSPGHVFAITGPWRRPSNAD